LTFAQVKAYLRNHSGDIRERIEAGDALCTTIALLLELYLEDPDHLDTIGILTQAVQEYKEECEFYPYYTAGKPTQLN
jgi:hypothetical protein